MFNMTDNQLADFVQKWIPMIIVLLVVGFLLVFTLRGTDFSSAFSMKDILSVVSEL